MRPLSEIEFIAGSAEDIVVPLLDADDAPVASLAGWVGRCQVRYSPDNPAVLVEWSTAAASLVLADSAARLVVSAALAEASLAWPWRLGWFDLKLTTPAGQGSLPFRPCRGIMRVVPAVTI